MFLFRVIQVLNYLRPEMLVIEDAVLIISLKESKAIHFIGGCLLVNNYVFIVDIAVL